MASEVAVPVRLAKPETRADDLPTIVAKTLAILKRDALLAVSYEAQFAIQWGTIFSEVVIVYFISMLVPPSEHFGFDGSVGNYFSYAIVNIAFVAFQSTALLSFARTVRDGQTQGTLEVVLSTPTSLPLIVLSGGLWAFAVTTLMSIGTLLFALPFGLNLAHTNLLTLATFLVLTVASLSPLGVISAAATIVFKQTAPFDWIMSTLAYMFGGVYLPVSLLPHPLQVVGWFLPITHSLNGMRAAVNGARVTQVLPDALWLSVAVAILLPISLRLFDRAVEQAKADGTLGGY
jgi:ABC-2 type transport system permease protein